MPIVITVIIVMLVSVAVGVIFVKKYVCGGRLVYQFTYNLHIILKKRCIVLNIFKIDLCNCLYFALYRFLVHRYSVLQQHVEDNAAEGMDDPLESNHTQNGKIEFHDDSDEVLWLWSMCSYR